MMLTLLLLIPLLGALGLSLWPAALSATTAKRTAIVLLAIQLLASLRILLLFDPTDGGMQLQESFYWLSNLGLDYRLGIDGLSLPLVLINAVLTLVATIASRDISQRPRIYFSLLLAISGAVNGAFMSENTLLFFLFYED